MQSSYYFRLCILIGIFFTLCCSAIVNPNTDELDNFNFNFEAGNGNDGGIVGKTDSGDDTGQADADVQADASNDVGIPNDTSLQPSDGSEQDGATAYAPTHLDNGADLFDPNASDLVVSGELAIDTTVCSAGFATMFIVAQPSDLELCVLQAGNVIVDDGARLVARGNRPLVILSSGVVTINGIIDVSAEGTLPGPGGGRGGLEGSCNGSGPFPGLEATSGNQSFLNNSNGGGGGGGLCDRGGNGGNAGSFPGMDQPIVNGGQAGEAFPAQWWTSPLQGGSGGGCGTGSETSSGGGGGGALQISAEFNIIINGSIWAGGGGGQGGIEDSSSRPNPFQGSNSGAGGGGGSGGIVWLEAPVIEFGRNSKIGTNGGGGGSGYDSGSSDGKDGSESLEPASGGTDGIAGGSSGAGDFGSGMDGDSDPGSSVFGGDNNGGGGGGGVGCIMIRGDEIQLPTTINSLSPSNSPLLTVTTLQE